MTRFFMIALFAVLAACAAREPLPPPAPAVPLYPNETPELRVQIEAAAAANDVPVALVQRVVVRESTHRPGARNGPYYGLMADPARDGAQYGIPGPAE